MIEKKRSLLPGILLILLGVALLLRQMDLFYLRWRHVYPIVMLCIGGVLLYGVVQGKERSSIFAATVLLLLGGFFLCRNFDFFSFDYYFYDFRDYWPVVLVAMGLGFILQFAFQPDDWGVLIPGILLSGIGAVFLLRIFDIFYWLDFIDLWPIILIIVGILLIVSSLRKRSRQKMA